MELFTHPHTQQGSRASRGRRARRQPVRQSGGRGRAASGRVGGRRSAAAVHRLLSIGGSGGVEHLRSLNTKNVLRGCWRLREAACGGHHSANLPTMKGRTRRRRRFLSLDYTHRLGRYFGICQPQQLPHVGRPVSVVACLLHLHAACRRRNHRAHQPHSSSAWLRRGDAPDATL